MGLEQLRVKASRHFSDEKKRQLIPKVVIVGPSDTGKSTLARYLTNFAVRCGRTPLLVDLDCGQNSLSVPGTIASILVERPANAVAGFETKGAIALHYGHISPVTNYKLYTQLLERMADIVHAKANNDEKANISGYVINTCGWASHNNASYNSLLQVIQAFEVNIVVVMDSERLFNDITKDRPEFIK